MKRTTIDLLCQKILRAWKKRTGDTRTTVDIVWNAANPTRSRWSVRLGGLSVYGETPLAAVRRMDAELYQRTP